MTQRGILDTSAVVLLGRLHASDLPQEPVITAVTLAELSAEADFEPLPFDADAARAFGRVAASLRASGRKVQARSYDAMIAATAIATHLPLYTVNPDDFTGIEGLDLHSIPHPDQPSSPT